MRFCGHVPHAFDRKEESGFNSLNVSPAPWCNIIHCSIDYVFCIFGSVSDIDTYYTAQLERSENWDSDWP